MTLEKWKFKWSPWARIQSIGASIFILMGGIISLFYPKLYIALGTIATSIATIGVDYFEVSVNYYIRGVVLLGCSALAMLQAPTHTGGLCLFCAACTYIKAGLNGESPGSPKDDKK
jgi:hypothetical protein